MNLLIVCTGNTCRSPMAEKILQKKANEYKLDIDILSAGISAIEGYAASKNARKIMREYGLDDEHTTKRVNNELIEWADIILTMTMQHKKLLLIKSPNALDKVYTLKEYGLLDKLYEQIVPSLDINDPFSGSLKEYRDTANEIEQAIELLLKKINNNPK